MFFIKTIIFGSFSPLFTVRRNCQEKNSQKKSKNELSLSVKRCIYTNFKLYCQEKQEDLHWLLSVVLRTIKKSQSVGKLYVFLPEFYVENGIYLFQALWNYFLPLTTDSSIDGMFVRFFLLLLCYLGGINFRGV